MTTWYTKLVMMRTTVLSQPCRMSQLTFATEIKDKDKAEGDGARTARGFKKMDENMKPRRMDHGAGFRQMKVANPLCETCTRLPRYQTLSDVQQVDAKAWVPKDLAPQEVVDVEISQAYSRLFRTHHISPSYIVGEHIPRGQDDEVMGGECHSYSSQPLVMTWKQFMSSEWPGTSLGGSTMAQNKFMRFETAQKRVHEEVQNGLKQVHEVQKGSKWLEMARKELRMFEISRIELMRYKVTPFQLENDPFMSNAIPAGKHPINNGRHLEMSRSEFIKFIMNQIEFVGFKCLSKSLETSSSTSYKQRTTSQLLDRGNGYAEEDLSSKCEVGPNRAEQHEIPELGGDRWPSDDYEIRQLQKLRLSNISTSYRSGNARNPNIPRRCSESCQSPTQRKWQDQYLPNMMKSEMLTYCDSPWPQVGRLVYTSPSTKQFKLKGQSIMLSPTGSRTSWLSSNTLPPRRNHDTRSDDDFGATIRLAKLFTKSCISITSLDSPGLLLSLHLDMERGPNGVDAMDRQDCSDDETGNQDQDPPAFQEAWATQILSSSQVHYLLVAQFPGADQFGQYSRAILERIKRPAVRHVLVNPRRREETDKAAATTKKAAAAKTTAATKKTSATKKAAAAKKTASSTNANTGNLEGDFTNSMLESRQAPAVEDKAPAAKKTDVTKKTGLAVEGNASVVLGKAVPEYGSKWMKSLTRFAGVAFTTWRMKHNSYKDITPKMYSNRNHTQEEITPMPSSNPTRHQTQYESMPKTASNLDKINGIAECISQRFILVERNSFRDEAAKCAKTRNMLYSRRHSLWVPTAPTSTTLKSPTKIAIKNFANAGLHPTKRRPSPPSRTGSGKTAAYLIPIISKLIGKAKKLWALRPNTTRRSVEHPDFARRVVCATRYRSMLLPRVAYGSYPIGASLDELGKGCDILAGISGEWSGAKAEILPRQSKLKYLGHKGQAANRSREGRKRKEANGMHICTSGERHIDNNHQDRYRNPWRGDVFGCLHALWQPNTAQTFKDMKDLTLGMSPTRSMDEMVLDPACRAPESRRSAHQMENLRTVMKTCVEIHGAGDVWNAACCCSYTLQQQKRKALAATNDTPSLACRALLCLFTCAFGDLLRPERINR
ncbi:uncharacterized protein MYCFIDRAFT_180354 [Pseudocercospora fijiensis CIRAD86]|uniref:Uncharacterized protein n=1 Tax=Pseudocercospora fijiensis (strain CIRAD86) TaxID=383855 RepID=M2ZY23_PSEFD|nr:uncharacterized protein MYCFIDRAFT_180354 [Pseudocercospora fijiensis CIRAD86]EME77021.1 hypothetical protein MYCFIDRAFT_180354 [Pseudocercospora fijiensis CIRAD86]